MASIKYLFLLLSITLDILNLTKKDWLVPVKWYYSEGPSCLVPGRNSCLSNNTILGYGDFSKALGPGSPDD